MAATVAIGQDHFGNFCLSAALCVNPRPGFSIAGTIAQWLPKPRQALLSKMSSGASEAVFMQQPQRHNRPQRSQHPPTQLSQHPPSLRYIRCSL